MDILNSLLPTMGHFHILGYWIAFLLAFLETIVGIGLFIPGSSALLIMGAMSAGGSFDIGDLIFFAVCGAIIGDNISYYIGRRFGYKISSKGFWIIKKSHLDKGREFLNAHGAKSIFLGRFVPSIKEVAPLIAGTLKMKRLSFVFWNILGAIGWSLVWILPGYFFAQSLDTAQLWLSRSGFFFFAFFIFLVLFYILKYIFIKKGQAFFRVLKSLWQSIKQAIITNPEIEKYFSKHPRFFRFLADRFDKRKFFGRTFSFSLVAFIYVLFLFGGIIEDFLASNVITSVDIRIAHLLLLFRDWELIKIFLWITILGKSYVVLLVSVSAILILWLLKKRYYILPFIVTLAGGVGFNYLGKILFHRPRPDMPVYIEKSFSFPSGHATIAVALYGFLAYILIREIKSWKVKVNIVFGSIFLIFLIGFSRIYLGVHYLSDVWSGYLLGALWLIIGISIAEYIFSRNKIEKTRIVGRDKIISWIIILICFISYFVLAFNYQPILLGTLSANQNKTILIQPTDIFSSQQLRYTETLTGSQQEPINFIILAKDEDQLINLFNKAGWSLADRVDINSMIKIIKAVVYKKSYDTAPMTPSFWNAKTHNFGFEKPTQTESARQRHHARFWKTGYLTEKGYSIYVGTASFDQGIKWGITHKISPDIDTERELIFKDLQKVGVIQSYTKEKTVDPVLGANFAGDQFFTDGNMYIIQLVSNK